MAEQSLISAVVANKPPRMDPDEFRPKKADQLDVVSEPFQARLEGRRESSLKKVATFKPANLKNLSSGIQESTTRRKLTAAVKNAEQKLVSDKVQVVREQNPFNNIAEKQAGRSLNIIA